MKLTKKLEAEILNLYHRYWDAYLKGDMKTFSSFLDDNIMIYGSASGEVFSTKKEALKFYKATAHEITGKLDFRKRRIKIKAAGATIIINELCDIYVLAEKIWIFYGHARITAVLEKKGNTWKVIQQHASFPDVRTGEGEQIATEKIKNENLQLREAVQRRTVELETKNRELAIEASLEKVRAVAMGMKKADDMLSICKTISQQLAQLGVKEIRNVQTAIIHESKGTYMNYEYYAKHDKLLSTEVSYINHPMSKAFVKKMLDGPNKFFKRSLTKEKTHDWYAFQKKSTNQFADKFLLKASSLNYYWYSLGPVALGISTYAPLSKEEQDLFVRFRNVFELAYRRFLDIEEAAAQAREVEIELSLERVRSAAMGMKQSGEIGNLIHHLYTELTKLDARLDRCFIMIVNPVNKGITWWLAGKEGLLDKNGFFIQYNEHPSHLLYLNYWKKRQKKWHYLFEGKEKKDWDRFGFSKTELSKLPEPVKKDMAGVKKVFLSGSSDSFGCLVTGSIEPLSEQHQDIISRFALVFNQTYTRFLDLQKAEAQAREAQIEAALERVRSRSMAMHRSDELKDVIRVVLQQFVHLNINVEHAGFYIDYKAQDDMHIWLADPNLEPFYAVLPYFDSPTWKSFLDAKATGKSFYTDLLDFKTKNKFYRSLFKIFTVPETAKKFYLKCKGLAVSSVLLDNVGLYIENFSAIPYSDEENKILMRFGKVFQQTYTRFLDLQKAEAQAREAKIEAALERTRTQSMLMQHSDELKNTANVFHEQLKLLGIDSEFSYLWLPDEEKANHLFWATWDETENEKTVIKNKSVTYPLDKTEPSIAACYVAWESGEPIHVNPVTPAEVKNYFATWSELLAGIEKFKPKYFKNGLYYIDAYMKYGCFGIVVRKELTDDEKKIVGRFTIEFERTYTRFLDLQKAEAQAREAQIEVALERVRSRTMAMHKSEDLSETSVVLFNELKKLGIQTTRSGFGIYDEADQAIQLWLTAVSGQLSEQNVLGTIPFQAHYAIRENYKAWKEKKSTMVHTFSGKEVKEYYQKIGNYLSIAPQKKYPERLVFSVFFFSEGSLNVMTEEPLTEDDNKIMFRFANVFGLTYRRFLDLQKAEAQAEIARLNLIQIQEEKQRAEDALTELQATQKQLIQSEKMASLGELTAGIAHEIQNPLNFVNNFSEVSSELIKEMVDEVDKGNTEEVKLIANDVVQNLEKINHHGKRAADIVKGMLQHSRSNSGAKEPTDINALADEYLRLAYHGLRAKDKTFNATMKTDFDVSIGNINIIPQDMGRVILNLITNAFYVVNEKSKQGIAGYEPTVSITTSSIQPPLGGRVVQIKVSDNGGGIPPKVLEKIFQPFFTTKPTGQGTGLGLSLSYDIVKAHGGELKVETKDGEGTEFIIQLPAMG